MVRWGQIDQAINFKKVAESVYLPDLYREAAKELGLASPTINYKTEGGHTGPWSLDKATTPIAMGPDKFFDGMSFDPIKAVEYLKGFPVHNMKVSLADFAKVNK
jgi:nitrate/nitrite transport system substrate-binding protein